MRDIPGDEQTSVAAVAERLKEARSKVYPSAARAATALGLEGPTVRAHESGQNGFPVSRAAAYATAYGVSLEWLLTGSGDPPKGEPVQRGRRSEATVKLEALPNGKARLHIETEVPMSTALKVLALLEGGE